MSYVLDTNTVSAVMAGEPQVLARLASLAKTEVAIPQPALAEIAYGLARLPRSKRRDRLRSAFALVAGELPRAPWTDAVSAAFGTIKASLERRGQRIEDIDVAIAAHALSSGAVLVTANQRHMQRIRGLRLETWTDA